MATASGQTQGANRNLVNACKRFYDHWLPVSEEALARIKDGLATDAYELDSDFFFEDLKTDIGLFTYFLRQARRKIQKRAGKDSLFTLGPRDLFNELTTKECIQIFDINSKDISPHSLKSATDNQALQLRELVVSASATEALASEQDLDGIVGFSVSSLKQVGRSLIAWNYPEVYEEALQKAGNAHGLDDALTYTLGFSPQLLVIALARDWGLSSEIRAAVGDKQAAANADKDVQQVSSMLSKLYEVGATVARAYSPELYPNASEDWEIAKQAVKELIGPDGMKVVQNQVKNNCFHYLEVAPEIFEASTRMDPAPIPKPEDPTPISFKQNKYVRFLTTDAQEALRDLYVAASRGECSKAEAIRMLLKDIAPIIGFARGCIYLLDPETMRLTPRLTIGPAIDNAYKPVHAFSVSTRTINPIGAAYHCSTPIIHSDFTLSAQGEICFSSILGQRQRVGVLYLEPEEALEKSPDARLLQRFKSIVLAFEHILGIT